MDKNTNCMRKYLLFLTLLTIASSCCSKVSYLIEGTAPQNAEGRTICLYNLSTEKGIDTTTIIDGKFEFSGGLEQNAMATIYTTGNKIDIVLEGGKTSVSLTDKLRVVSGGKLNIALREYRDSMDKLGNEANRVFEKIFVSKTDSNWISINSLNITNEYNSRFFQLKKSTLNANKENIIGAYLYNSFIEYRTMEQIERFYKTNIYAANFERLNRVIREGHKLGKLNKGKMYADFTAKDKDNNKDIKLSSFVGRGNYVLLYIWSSKCKNSIEGANIIGQMSDKYSPEGLVVIGVNILDEYKDMNREMTEYKMNWMQIYDSSKYNFEALYAAYTLPYIILIDPKGKIIETELTADIVDSTLSKIYPIKAAL